VFLSTISGVNYIRGSGVSAIYIFTTMRLYLGTLTLTVKPDPNPYTNPNPNHIHLIVLVLLNPTN